MGKDAAQLHAEFQARLVQFARELRRDIFPDGLPEGMTFSELEDIAVAVGNEVSRELVENQLRARPQVDPQEQTALCPTCAGPLRKGPLQARKLTTTRGQVTWIETTTKCPRCRRAFSPSESDSGT
jgi:hypothetical protein